MSALGESKIRVDAELKATGEAMYTDDFFVPNCLTAKIVRSTIANGVVKSFDLSEAEKIEGVVKIITCFDVPDRPFATAGHPWSTDPKHQDIQDRLLLNTRVRIYGDDIAVVIAESELAAEKAARRVRVEYEEYKPVLDVDEALKDEKPLIHEERGSNLVVKSSYKVGDKAYEDFEGKNYSEYHKIYNTPSVQHCQIENAVSVAHVENGRVIIYSSTQIPHIVRRVVAQALSMPYGKIKVVKPYIGGGFGVKQDVLYEPLAAFLSLQVGGRPVKIELTREENFVNTRARHAIDFEMDTICRCDGRLMARKLVCKSNQGGYASHAHAVVANAANAYRMLYQDKGVLEGTAMTVYTNRTVGGAMRGYGIPQICFAMEAHMDDIAADLKMDPIEFRKKNMMRAGYVDPNTGITCHSYGLEKCIDKGAEIIGWSALREKYACEKGDIRRGVGMGIFCYKTGVYPISLETASCRMVLDQDGSCQLQMGATEIGQGADTVFAQMCSESTGISFEKIHTVSFQDTDVAPFDTGAYASRQSYVSGKAVKKCAALFKQKIIDYAGKMLGTDTKDYDIVDDVVISKDTGEVVISVQEIAMEAFYSLSESEHITAEVTSHCTDNTYSFGCTFAEIEVDIPVGKIKVLRLVNVHDCGKVLNPKLAEAQVHGGMSMGLGYALSEEMKYDEKTGRLLNDNLLDYKLETCMDTPKLEVAFVETYDESGPYGNKSLGEPPTLTVAPAIRNALLNATGVAVDSLPLSPEKLVGEFKAHGLIK